MRISQEASSACGIRLGHCHAFSLSSIGPKNTAPACYAGAWHSFQPYVRTWVENRWCGSGAVYCPAARRPARPAPCSPLAGPPACSPPSATAPGLAPRNDLAKKHPQGGDGTQSGLQFRTEARGVDENTTSIPVGHVIDGRATLPALHMVNVPVKKAAELLHSPSPAAQLNGSCKYTHNPLHNPFCGALRCAGSVA